MNLTDYRTQMGGRIIPMFSVFRDPLFVMRGGFTLIELLVVISITVLLVAASVPMLKPMFESQKTKNAAQTVAAALQRVRFKAMEEQTTYGISFAPFNNNQNVAVQMRIVKMGNKAINNSNLRVQIVGGEVHLYQFNAGNWTAADQTTWETEWNSNVESGYKIQLGRQGRLYEIGIAKADLTAVPNPVYPRLAAPYENLNLPENSPPNATMEYSIIQPPRSSLSPPVALPRGTVIDLQFSTGCISTEIPSTPANPEYYNNNKLYFNASIQNIMFTPNGYIDYFNGDYSPFYGGLIYFCIGEWERGLGLAEDGKNNIETMTNFWVTLNPKTGQIRITEMAPHDSDPTKLPIENARKFAAEHFGVNND
ncbi:MAG: prepilin-type N-terminal cleavage/methylation domain-containing protein [Planctomycetaceae bacterium]|jgi:prepilin-type N-terminal cleavage/methylation domain-containing protein|nr:prepilin-type N-terminal cleavage/methylation domain-containing protein [Planctomycetaceae bacterium]